MLYRVYIEYQGGMIMASQHNSASLCLDKYRRLRKQGHKSIEIRFKENVIKPALSLVKS
mgnify:CR=1 FL=1